MAKSTHRPSGAALTEVALNRLERDFEYAAAEFPGSDPVRADAVARKTSETLEDFLRANSSVTEVARAYADLTFEVRGRARSVLRVVSGPNEMPPESQRVESVVELQFALRLFVSSINAELEIEHCPIDIPLKDLDGVIDQFALVWDTEQLQNRERLQQVLELYVTEILEHYGWSGRPVDRSRESDLDNINHMLEYIDIIFVLCDGISEGLKEKLRALKERLEERKELF